MHQAVADSGFDLRGGGVDFVNGVGEGCRKSLKVLTVEVKVICQPVLAMFLPKLGLKLIASEKKLRTICVWGINKIIGPRPLRGSASFRY